MATQRYISTSFWDDAWVQSIDPSEKLLYLYLMTNPLTNIAGIYKVTEKRIHDDTGFNIDMIKKLMGRFEKAHKAYRFGEYIVIPNWPRHQKWKEKKTIETGIRKILAELPNSIRSKAKEVGYQYPIDTIPASYVYEPSYLDSDLDIDLDSDIDIASDEKESPAKPSKDRYTDQFNTFWEAYPRRSGKGQAAKVYASKIKKGMTPDEIQSRLSVYKAQIEAAGTLPQYIRHPSTFLNNLDDYHESARPQPKESLNECLPYREKLQHVTLTQEEREMIARSYEVAQ